MEFKYPVAKADGKEYTANELYGKLANEKTGFYLLSANQFWHGGIHLTNENFAHCTKDTPVQAIAEGTVIAYRINQDNLLIPDEIFIQYSSGFCLIKHEYKSSANNPAPTNQEKNQQWQGRTIVLDKRRNVRNVESLNLTKNSHYLITLPKGTELQILTVSDQLIEEYYFAKVKIVMLATDIKVNNKGGTEVTVSKDTELYIAFSEKGGAVNSKLYSEKDIPEKWKDRLVVLKTATESYKDAQKTVLATLPAETKVQLLEASNTTGAPTKAKLLYDINVTPDSTATILKKDQKLWISLFDDKGQVTQQEDKPIVEDTHTTDREQYNFTFYSLYMHLCSYNDYLKPEEQIVIKQTFTINTDKLNVRETYRGAGGKAIGTISNGATVEAEINANTLKTKGNITDLKATIKSGTFTAKAGVTTTVKGVDDEIWVPIKEGNKSFIKETMPELPKPPKEMTRPPPKEMTRPSYWEGTVTAKVKKADGLKIWKKLESDELKEPIGDINVGNEFTFDSTQVKIITHNSKSTMVAECTSIDTLTFRKEGEQIDKFWTLVDKDSITREKVKPTSFDTVIACKAKVTAGEALGYLGVFQTPSLMCEIVKKRQVHVEVFTPDPLMVDFLLNNPLGLKEGKQFIRLPKETELFARPIQYTPIATPPGIAPAANYILKQDHVFAIDDLTLDKNLNGTEWYNISTEQHTGQVQKTKTSPEIVNQHQWKKLGFELVKEANPSADGYLDPNVMPAIFKEIYNKIDTNKDGKLQQDELKSALKDQDIREQWSKLIAYHPSEWKKDTKPLFERFEKLLTPPDDVPDEKKAKAKKLLEQEKERMTKLVFLEDITPTIPILLYHFHPVAFIENMKQFGLIDIEAFIKEYKKKHQSFANTSNRFNTTSEKNLKEVLKNINIFYSKHLEYKPNIYELSYMFATARWEAYQYRTAEYFSSQPENGSISYFNKYDPVLASTTAHQKRAKLNGNTKRGDGYKYRGRGLVQLTWKNNYIKAKNYLNVDVVTFPDKALEYENAVPIMIWGMHEGIFTGKKLSDYINSIKVDYVGARKIINGTDHNRDIASYARIFEDILKLTSTASKDFN